VTKVGGDRALRHALVVASLAGLATLIVICAPALRVGYREPGGRIVLETTATLIGGLVAVLLYGRYQRSRLVRELLLVHAMAVLSMTSLVLAAGSGFRDATGFATNPVPVARTVGAVLIFSAALISPTRARRAARPAHDLTGVAAVVATVSLISLLLGGRAPGLLVAGGAASLAVQVATLGCYLIAAPAFIRTAARDGDDLVGWFGAAAVIGAAAQINYLVSQVRYPDGLVLADLLRLTFFVLLFASAIREVQRHWSAQAAAAAHSERRRLARDLHDGVVQELGYIRSRAARAHASQAGPFAQEILAAAERALDEARRSIDALTSCPSEALSVTLQREAVEVSGRYDLTTHVDVAPYVSVTPARRDALVRIVREAISNAARHGAPRGVVVKAADGELTVRDDGRGFDPAASRHHSSFGLVSMSERAASVGAVVQITSAPGCGTTVRVTW
jgi:signal transduction histidine kinase